MRVALDLAALDAAVCDVVVIPMILLVTSTRSSSINIIVPTISTNISITIRIPNATTRSCAMSLRVKKSDGQFY